MTKFADQLFTDLMNEHGPALETVPPPARRTVPRPVWLAAGVVGMAGAVTAGVAVFGGGTPAYAVTDNGNGTVTISLHQLSGVDGANGALRGLGDRVVVVPVQPGCPAIGSLPIARPGPRNNPTGVSVRAGSSDGRITVDAHGVPAGDTMLVAASHEPNGMRVSAVLISGPAPRCVSGVAAPPPHVGPGSGSGSELGSGGGGSGPIVSTGH